MTTRVVSDVQMNPTLSLSLQRVPSFVRYIYIPGDRLLYFDGETIFYVS